MPAAEDRKMTGFRDEDEFRNPETLETAKFEEYDDAGRGGGGGE